MRLVTDGMTADEAIGWLETMRARREPQRIESVLRAQNQAAVDASRLIREQIKQGDELARLLRDLAAP